MAVKILTAMLLFILFKQLVLFLYAQFRTWRYVRKCRKEPIEFYTFYTVRFSVIGSILGQIATVTDIFLTDAKGQVHLLESLEDAKVVLKRERDRLRGSAYSDYNLHIMRVYVPKADKILTLKAKSVFSRSVPIRNHFKKLQRDNITCINRE
ncbi:MAG: hypothetical protein HQL57_04465 [Magnetococcales bacterium]|nr:hypothetical protein [Magnetococcales bacterium]